MVRAKGEGPARGKRAATRRPGGLTPKQRRFCEEYLIDLNATQAAMRAGYSTKTAYSIGQRLLKNVEIQDAIAEGVNARSQETGITVARVLKEYGRLAFLDVRKAFDDGGRLLPIRAIDDDTAAAIAGLEVEAIYEGRGDDRERVGTLSRIKLSDKIRALDSIGKHLGMFVDRHEFSGPDGGPIYKAYLGFNPDDV